MNPPPNDSSELLQKHVGWLRALARELVSDPELAEDLTQDTLVIALERPPRDAGALRSWLSRVLRNRSAERYRGALARRGRETSRGPSADAEATDEIASRMQLQRLLADTLQELDEPFRRTVFLRFYEDLPPRAIAKREGIAVATVKSRLARGLALLRRKLDRAHGGDGESWAIALLPLARDFTTPAALTLGGIAVNAKLAASISVVLLVAAWFAWFESQDDDAPAPVSTEPVAVLEQPELDAGEAARAPSTRESARVAATTGSPVNGSDEADAAVRFEISGRVLDAEGRPVAGLPVRVRDARQAPVKTDGQGRFTLSSPADRGALEVAEDGWVTVRAGSFWPSNDIEPVVIAARALDVAGTVVDSFGTPVSDATIRLALPANFESRFDVRLDNTLQAGWSASSAEDGAFALTGLPAVSGASLGASHTGHTAVSEPLPSGSTAGLVLRLEPPALAAEFAVSGRVLLPDGAPAPEARVALGLALVSTNSRGEFTLDHRQRNEATRLIAVQEGFQPGVLEADEWDEFLEVRLGPPTLSIAGRVVDHEGEPRAGVRVWLEDRERFGVLGNVALSTEALAAGAPLPASALEFLAERAGSGGRGEFGSAMPQMISDAILHWAETGDDGRFELGGLLDRDYVLNALDSRLAHGARVEARAGDEDVQVELPLEDTWPTLRGRLVTSSGAPVPDVNVSSYVSAVREQVEVQGGEALVTRFFMGPSARTGDDGTFEFSPLLARHVQLWIAGESIVPTSRSVEDATDPLDFEIVVQARIHFSVELIDPLRADRFLIHDAAGKALQLNSMRADGHSTFVEKDLTDGRSGSLVVTSEARTLTLFKDGEVVETVELNLLPGEPNVVRL